MMKGHFFVVFVSFFSILLRISPIFGQNDHAFFIKDIYDYSLTKAKCYERLHYLSEEIGGRMTGTENAANAVSYTAKELEFKGTKVWKQSCMVPSWVRKEEAKVQVKLNDGSIRDLHATALGNSIGTGGKQISGEIIEVFSLDTLGILGEKSLKDKIVFFNRPMDPTQVHTGWAYGGAVDQRVNGAARSSLYGAKAALIRSMTTLIDSIPHTGVSSYGDVEVKIPAIAISTMDAEWLSAQLSTQKVIKASLSADCYMEDDKESHNVIAEIKGSEFPNEIILVGGHLDSWDLGGGAHDDGAGCVHSIQVFETLLALNYKPKRTLRCVMFMNEENGLAGGKRYAEVSDSLGEFHLAAIESDMGGFTPRGFGCSANDEVFKTYLRNFQTFSTYLEPYDLYLKSGGGGADINPLKPQGGLLIGFKPDSQRYFDLHHTKLDRIDKVNKRELELGAAAITSLVYLLDQFGLKGVPTEE